MVPSKEVERELERLLAERQQAPLDVPRRSAIGLVVAAAAMGTHMVDRITDMGNSYTQGVSFATAAIAATMAFCCIRRENDKILDDQA